MCQKAEKLIKDFFAETTAEEVSKELFEILDSHVVTTDNVKIHLANQVSITAKIVLLLFNLEKLNGLE